MRGFFGFNDHGEILHFHMVGQLKASPSSLSNDIHPSFGLFRSEFQSGSKFDFKNPLKKSIGSGRNYRVCNQ